MIFHTTLVVGLRNRFNGFGLIYKDQLKLLYSLVVGQATYNNTLQNNNKGN